MSFEKFKLNQEKEGDKSETNPIPPQYRGMKSSLLDEMWIIPVYTDEEKNQDEQQKKTKALEWLREKESRERQVQPEPGISLEVTENNLDELKKEQETKDREQFEEVRKKLNEDGQEARQESELDYSELKNVQIGRDKLDNLLKKDADVETISNCIRELLTTRSEFTELKEGVGGDLSKLLEMYSEEKKQYDELRENITKSIDSNEDLEWSSNPAWFGINTRPEAPKKEGGNIKIYATIPMDNPSFIRNMPSLATKLRKIAIESDDEVKVKFPGSFTGFMAHNDSLVIHFKNEDSTEALQEVLDKWMKEFGITEAPREMGRTKVAADSRDGKSFSEVVSNNIATWLEENKGKYEDSLLADLAVKHAIKQSQKSPSIEKRYPV